MDEQAPGLPKVSIPGSVSWADTTLSTSEFIRQIRSAILQYQTPLWRRLLTRSPQNQPLPQSVAEANTLLSELETLTASSDLSPDIRERWVLLCRHIKVLIEHYIPDKQVQALLDLVLAKGIGQLPSSIEANGSATPVHEDEELALIDAALKSLDGQRFPDLYMYAQAEKAKTLFELSVAATGDTKRSRLVASTMCLDKALELCRRERFPDVWNTLHLIREFQLFLYALFQEGADRIKTLRMVINDSGELIRHISDDANHKIWITSHALRAGALHFLSMAVPANYKADVFKDTVITADSLIAAHERDNDRTAVAYYKFTKANALSEMYYLGAFSPTQAASATLMARDDYDAAIEGIPREVDAHQWALAHHFKGKLLQSVHWFDYKRHNGKNSGRLREAIESFDNALSVFTEDSESGLFAEINDYKGSTLGQLARVPETYPYEDDQLTDSQRIDLYTQAVACFDAALRGYSHSPIASAIMLNNKGNALRDMALLLEPAEALEMLQHAMGCYDEAIEEQEQEKDGTNLRRSVGNKQIALAAVAAVEQRMGTPEVIELDSVTSARLIRMLDHDGNNKVSEDFFDLPDVAKVRETIQALASGVDEEHLGVVILGKPKSGKTTLAREILKAVAPDFYLLMWWPLFHPQPSELRALKGRKVIVFVEWVRMVMEDEHEAKALRRAIVTLRDICPLAVVVATADTSDEAATKSNVLGEFADQLIEIEIRPLTPLDADAAGALHSMELATRAAEGSWRRVDEDASGEAGYQHRVAILRGADFPIGAKRLLQALWLLRSLGIHQSEDTLIQAVARDVFNLSEESDSWDSVKEWLRESGWILEEMDPVSRKILLVPRISAYVDSAVPDAFSVAPLDKLDCLSKLTTLFTRPPVNAEGLLAVSDAALKISDLPEQARGLRSEIIIQSLESALPMLDSGQTDDQARQHAILGRAYVQRTSGVQVDNLHSAIREYQKALDACPEDVDQYRATLQWSMASALALLASVTKGDTQHRHLTRAIQYYKQALEVLTKASAPEDWAQITASMGRVLGRMSQDDPSNTDMAIEALSAALSVMTPDRDGQEWAMLKLDLGNEYLKRASKSHDTEGIFVNDLDAARKAFTDALIVFSIESSPKPWAFTHFLLASTFALELTPVLQSLAGIDATAESLCRRLLDEYNAALSVLTYETDPNMWIAVKQMQSRAYLLMALTGQPDRMADLSRKSAEQALACITNNASPDQWQDLQRLRAMAMMLHALARQDSDQGGDAEIKEAMHAVGSALDTTSRTDEPIEWALLNFYLGQGYAMLEEGDESDNIERAIDALESSLSGLHRDATPSLWVMVCWMSAVCYRDRIRGNRHENLETAAARCRSALSVIGETTKSGQEGSVAQLQSQMLLFLGLIDTELKQ